MSVVATSSKMTSLNIFRQGKVAIWFEINNFCLIHISVHATSFEFEISITKTICEVFYNYAMFISWRITYVFGGFEGSNVNVHFKATMKFL